MQKKLKKLILEGTCKAQAELSKRGVRLPTNSYRIMSSRPDPGSPYFGESARSNQRKASQHTLNNVSLGRVKSSQRTTRTIQQFNEYSDSKLVYK